MTYWNFEFVQFLQAERVFFSQPSNLMTMPVKFGIKVFRTAILTHSRELLLVAIVCARHLFIVFLSPMDTYSRDVCQFQVSKHFYHLVTTERDSWLRDMSLQNALPCSISLFGLLWYVFDIKASQDHVSLSWMVAYPASSKLSLSKTPYIWALSSAQLHLYWQ